MRRVTILMLLIWIISLTLGGLLLGKWMADDSYDKGYEAGVKSQIAIQEKTNLQMEKEGACEWMRIKSKQYGCIK